MGPCCNRVSRYAADFRLGPDDRLSCCIPMPQAQASVIFSDPCSPAQLLPYSMSGPGDPRASPAGSTGAAFPSFMPFQPSSGFLLEGVFPIKGFHRSGSYAWAERRYSSRS